VSWASFIEKYCSRPFVAGVDAFCTLSLGRPNRTHGANRRPAVPAATTTVRAANDNVGESPMFESIGDLEGKVVRLNAL